jgi:hypothetical protein
MNPAAAKLATVSVRLRRLIQTGVDSGGLEQNADIDMAALP